MADFRHELNDYLLEPLRVNAAQTFAPPVTDAVTALIYYFRRPNEIDATFPLTAAALTETWRHCGLLKTVIVTDQLSAPVRDFADRYANVEVQVESDLVPGDIDTLSRDCNGKLYSRFNTDFVLTVQDDGFPLCAGLTKFVKKYDFIGAATACRNSFRGNLLCSLLHYNPSNGGFSLRSKRCCELAANYWNRIYAHRPFNFFSIEDNFLTRFLPARHFLFNRCVRIAPPKVAYSFSYEACPLANPTTLPFGFHGAESFHNLKPLLPTT